MPAIPNVHTVPYPDDPTQLFALFRQWPWAMWLDSGTAEHAAGRYHIMVAAPVCTVTVQGERTCVEERGRRWETGDEPLGVVRRLLERNGAGGGPAPFAGGAVGYFGYELGRRLEGLPCRAGPVPDMAVGIYRWALVLDRETRSAWLAGTQVPASLSRRLEEAMVGGSDGGPFQLGERVDAQLDRAAYGRAFNAAQRYIRDGDCYQINLANRLSVPFNGDALAAYRWLRNRAGGPFSAFLDLPYAHVLSLSPERFLSVQGARVETRPIKGTRPRRRDPLADEAQRRALAASAKDRAENVMIVDLLRNDLGRVCRPGSVRVPELCRLERFATVHHLVSTVVGELAPGRSALDAVRACLPGGSITGAPKHRAMEIIDELEGDSRGVYCGTIGYVGFDGNADLNIAIRTATRVAGELIYWAGGGLVAESQCRSEYRETWHKARPFLDLVRAHGRGEPAVPG